MFSLRRLGSVLHMAAVIAGAVGALTAAVLRIDLQAAARPAVGIYADMRRGRSREAQTIVSAALADLQERRVDRNRCVCVVFGTSGARDGLHIPTITNSDRGDCLYLGLCFAGRNIAEIADICDVVLQSELRPQLAVIAIAPFQVMEGDIAPLMLQADQPEAALPTLTLLHERRDELRLSADEALSVLRSKMLQPFEPIDHQPQPIDHRTAPRMNPWLREMTNQSRMQNDDPAAAGLVLSLYDTWGYFDPAGYHKQMDGLGILMTLVRQFNSKGTRVVLVFNPEHSALRESIPSQAVPTIKAALEEAFGPGAVPILNFRELLQDREFRDVVHPNPVGQQSYSRAFAAGISDLLYDN